MDLCPAWYYRPPRPKGFGRPVIAGEAVLQVQITARVLHVFSSSA